MNSETSRERQKFPSSIVLEKAMGWLRLPRPLF
jgi:hypothetical protein